MEFMMDWRATVNLTIIVSFITLFVLCPYSVEGEASLRGIEHSFRVGKPSHAGNYKPQDAHHLHNENIVLAHTDDIKDYNDIEYENDDIATGINNDYYDDNPDRSYKYEFSADGYSKTESSDASGYVEGSYSYVDDQGKHRSLSYRAGADIGFVPFEAEGLHPEIMESFVGFGKRQTSIDSATPSNLFSLNSRSTIPSRNHGTLNIKSSSSSRTSSQLSGYVLPSGLLDQKLIKIHGNLMEHTASVTSLQIRNEMKFQTKTVS
jgi:hypothetical protein